MSIEASVFYEQNPRTGYDTVRWFYDSSYSQEIAEGDRVEANGRKIYAKWIANPYTVYYDANGGRGSIPPQAVEYDQTFRLSSNTFTRTGYTFLNWNTYPDAVGGKTFTDGQEVVNLAGTASNRDRVTLYAVWRSHAEIQQQYQDQLTDFFRAFQTNSYYPEDWASLQSIRRVASETVAQSGGDESAMQTALETAYEEARNVSTKEQRAQAVAQSWRTAHSGILSQISVPVSLDRLEETSLLAQAAIADAGTEWLAQQSTLTEPASRQDAARAAQDKLATEVQQLQSMQHAIVWLGSVKDAYQVPLSSVTSADAEGTFAWKDGSVAPPQTGAYPVVFTPKDGTAYRTVEFYISVTVNEPVPEVPSSSGMPAAPAPGSSSAQPSSPAPGGTASSSAPVSSKPQSGSSSASVSQPGSSSSASAAESGSVSSSGSSSDAQEPAAPKTPAGLILAVVAAVGAAAAAVFLILSKKRK